MLVGRLFLECLYIIFSLYIRNTFQALLIWLAQNSFLVLDVILIVITPL